MEPYADADHPDRILVWETWATRADQESYLRWRRATGFLEGLGPYLAESPRILHLHRAE
jgi:quinol monooxygenase YgiN